MTFVGRAGGMQGWLSDPTVRRADLKAGLIVAVMLVPQAMAYAGLAGLPPVHGLYASMVPILIYALIGTSRQLAVGPVAIVSLLTASALGPLAGGSAAAYAALAAVLAIMVGAIQIGFGLLRLGALTSLLSHPVLSGFTSGAAIVIAFSQVRALLGLSLPRPEGFVEGVAEIAKHLGEINATTLMISAASVALLIGIRRFRPGLPGPLLVVVAGVLAVVAADLTPRGVAVIGEVPSGLPAPRWPSMTWDTIQMLLPTAFAIALIGYAEGISIAKAMAAKTKHEVDANRELLAVGAANVASGVFQAFPVAGGFSRTAVNQQAGARTTAAGVVTAILVAISVVAFAPSFQNIPKAVLAAIIVVAVAGLVSVGEALRVWRTRRRDGIALLVTFATTVLAGVEMGLLAGVGVSLALFIYSSSRPHSAELGRVVGSDVYRNVGRYQTVTDPTVAILRVDGTLSFVASTYLRDRILSMLATRPDLRLVVLDASGVSDLDSSGVHALDEIHRDVAAAGVELVLATVRGPVRDVIVRADLMSHAPFRVFADIDAALEECGFDADHPIRRPAPDEPVPDKLY